MKKQNNMIQYLIPLKRKRYFNTIVSQIKTLILSKKINLGEKLPSERELADKFKVSRAVVHQALLSLEQLGLIEIRPGPRGGGFVTDNTHKPVFDFFLDLFKEGGLTLHHFYEARKAIECDSIRLALEKITEQDIQRLRCINRKIIEKKQDKSKFHNNNMEFHMEVADISGNPLIKSLVGSVLELLNTISNRDYPETFQSISYIEDTFNRHQQIIEALSEKNGELCEEHMAIDVERTKNLTTQNQT